MTSLIVQFQLYLAFHAINHQKDFHLDCFTSSQNVLQAVGHEQIVIQTTVLSAVSLQRFDTNMFNNLFHFYFFCKDGDLCDIINIQFSP